MRFSERIGAIKAKDKIQLESMDLELRNGLWNAVQLYYFDKIGDYIHQSYYSIFFQILWHKFFKLPLDTLDNWFPNTKLKIRTWFYKWKWYEVYDFIEFIANTETRTDSIEFQNFCNNVFENELSAYRFINGIVTPITDKIEIEEIDSAISRSSKNKLIGVKTHLETALKLLADRGSPDYRNSIKESISAIESLSKIISNNNKDSLGVALKKISDRINLHPSLEKGFKQIYGYTSDADGIRHSLTEQSTSDFDDAKYILVSSSAFINYLIAKTNKAGIEL